MMIRMRNQLRHLLGFRGDDHGGATMEFVLGLPLLLVAMVFVFEFSSLFWAHHIAANNVRSAVRYLSRAPLEEPYLARAEQIAITGDPLDPVGPYEWMDGVTVTIDEDFATFTDTDFRTAGQVMRIEARVLFPLSTFAMFNAFSGGALADTLTLSIVEEARHYGE